MVLSKVSAVMMTLPPYSWRTVDPITGEGSFRGATITPFMRVLASLNITLDLRILDNVSWGNRLPNGTYTGMQRLAYEGETDVAIGPFFPSLATVTEMEPGFPHYRTRIVFLSGCRSLYATELSTAIFDLYVTLSIILCCLILPFILLFLQKADSQEYSILDAFEAVVSALLQEPADMKNVTSAPSRQIFIFWGVGCFIIMQLLSGILRSHTAVKTPVELLDSFEQVLRDPSIEITAWSDTPTLLVLREKRGVWGQEFMDRIQRTDTYLPSMDDVFSEQQVNKILDKRAIFVQEPETMISKGAPLCDKYAGYLHISEKENVEAELVWYYSPKLDVGTRRAISLRTMWAFETGVKWIQDREMFPVAPRCFTIEVRKLKDTKVGEAENFTLEQLFPFFYVLFYGHAISTGITVIEYFWNLAKRPHGKRQKLNGRINHVKLRVWDL